MCHRHQRRVIRNQLRHFEDEERRQAVRETRENLRIEFANVPWREMVDALAIRDDPNVVLYEAALGIVLEREPGTRVAYGDYWQWVRRGRVGAQPVAPAPVRRDLQILARDAQNVHTQAVSNQTNEAMNKLMSVDVPREQQTEKSMTRAWLMILTVSWNDMLRTLDDVNKWFNTKTCRSVDDNLYRKLLRGVVATINRTDDEMRPELYKRLWEECYESVGMCCEGHITRLCNVMVGFDSAYPAPAVPLGELIQQKMAAIAGFDVSTEEKQRQANQWFDENNVPAGQRTAWLEAF